MPAMPPPSTLKSGAGSIRKRVGSAGDERRGGRLFAVTLRRIVPIGSRGLNLGVRLGNYIPVYPEYAIVLAGYLG